MNRKILGRVLALGLCFGLAFSFLEIAAAASTGSSSADITTATPDTPAGAAANNTSPGAPVVSAAGTAYSLMFSRAPDRSNAVNLDGQAVSGNIYVFLSPTNSVKRVDFYIDNSTTSANIDTIAPFDLMGGSSSAANPYDSNQLANGSHSIKASARQASGKTSTVVSSFTVNNVPATATPTPTFAATPTPTATTPASGIPWGVNVSGAPWDMGPVTTFEANSGGKKVSLVHWLFTWDNGSGGYRSWAPGPPNNVVNHGSMPLMDWNPQGGDETRWKLTNITNGMHDTYIKQFAADVKNWNHPILIRMMQEMNGNWFNWSEDLNGNSRGDFVPAWQHIVDIYRAVGASNVQFVWCPNVVYPGATWPTLQSLYPGDGYVAWTCLDGYNWGSDFPRNGGWLTWDQVFNYAYNGIVAFAGSKPMVIGEFGSSENGGSKGDWFRDALEVQVPRNYPKVRAIVYFNYNMSGVDWRIESSSGSLAGWQEGISTTYYRNGW